ncbi:MULTISPECIES: hypothetical protein [unclassified Actinoplanes]|uniref:hypothetical protein n=1 Tax=unclassified Actinoplanes TaxID=2626549 RepID=UPI001E3D37D8|nr:MULTISPECIES: hypothetical protein [unclassified Actinoplanes]
MTSRKALTAATLVTTVGLTLAACTVEHPRGDKTTPPAANGSAGTPSMTFDEAYRKVPMNGTANQPITWDVTSTPDTEEVLAARRSFAFLHWEKQATDWAPILPIGRYLYTDDYYASVFAPFITSTSPIEDPWAGPIWVKSVGVEQMAPDRQRVTFCADLGNWHHGSEKPYAAPGHRGVIQSYEMQNVESGDGERHWLTDRVFNPDIDRQAKYGSACTKWAVHKP